MMMTWLPALGNHSLHFLACKSLVSSSVVQSNSSAYAQATGFISKLMSLSYLEMTLNLKGPPLVKSQTAERAPLASGEKPSKGTRSTHFCRDMWRQRQLLPSEQRKPDSGSPQRPRSSKHHKSPATPKRQKGRSLCFSMTGELTVEPGWANRCGCVSLHKWTYAEDMRVVKGARRENKYWLKHPSRGRDTCSLGWQLRIFVTRIGEVTERTWDAWNSLTAICESMS